MFVSWQDLLLTCCRQFASQKHQWQALSLHGAQYNFVTALEDALTQTMTMRMA